MTDLMALIVAILIFFAIVVAMGHRHSCQTESKELYLDLLRKCGGDKDTVERLVEGERKRNPNASKDSLIRKAVERWEQNRR